MKAVIEMARDQGLPETEVAGVFIVNQDDLGRFAELVRADERNRTWTQEHWTEYERSIVEAEREACAKVCDDWPNGRDDVYSIGQAIRARSNT